MRYVYMVALWLALVVIALGAIGFGYMIGDWTNNWLYLSGIAAIELLSFYSVAVFYREIEDSYYEVEDKWEATKRKMRDAAEIAKNVRPDTRSNIQKFYHDTKW